MEPGRFRHRLTLQNFTTVKSPSGQPQKEWFDLATKIPAECKAISSREIMSSGAEKAEATIRVWMRYRSDVTASSRLVCETGPFKGITLEVTGMPLPDAKMSRLEILCKQGVKS